MIYNKKRYSYSSRRILQRYVLFSSVLLTCLETALPTDDQSILDSSPSIAFDADCSRKPADVVFALDTSNSIWPRDFRQKLKFVINVVGHFPIDSGIIRVGVLTYADEPNLHFRLGQFERKSAILDAIGNIRHNGGYGTRTADALRFMRESGFVPVSKNRVNVTRVGIVVTDGLSDDPHQTMQEAEKTREKGIHLFAVGVGKDLNMKELHSIASHPLSFYTLLAHNYRGLDNIKDILAIKTCAVTNPTITTTTPTTTSKFTSFATSIRQRHATNKLGLSRIDHQLRTSAASEKGKGIILKSDSHNIESSAATGTNGRPNISINGSRYLNILKQRPSFWKLELDGRMTRLLEEFNTGSMTLPIIANGSEVTDDGEDVWSTGTDGNMNAVGKVINGTKFIGRWLSEDSESHIWWGYAVIESYSLRLATVIGATASASADKDGSIDKDHNEVENEKLHPAALKINNDDGFWVRDKAGRMIWYHYISPGVYESTVDDDSLTKVEDTTGADIFQIAAWSMNTTDERNSFVPQSEKGCHADTYTDVVFVLNSNSKQDELIRSIWNLTRTIVSKTNMNDNSLSFRIVHECEETAHLDLDGYTSKKDLLYILQTLPKTSADLIDRMTDLLTRHSENRLKRRKVGIYVSDGGSENFERTIVAADKAKHTHGIEMFTIGVGDGANPTELQAIASCPIAEHCFLSNKLNDQYIKNVSTEIGRLLCSKRS